ncbi:MAG: flagellar assembly protein FliW [Deltaproteobacteria bacterium]|nr:flagellar assembly protein FliW [Deltaproteobacteria bacterium]
MEKRRFREISTRIGRQRVFLDKCLYFPRGLIGFEKARDFVLLQVREGSPFLLLQCTEDPSLGLLVTDPYVFLEDWRIEVGTAEQKVLRVGGLRELAVLVTVTIPEGNPEKTALNLTGPVVINSRLRIGLQIPQTNGKARSNILISDLRPRAADPQPGPALLAGV